MRDKLEFTEMFMQKQLEILDKEIDLLQQDKSTRGIMLMGSVAYGTATDDSDLDILVLCDKDEFISKYIDNILVEIHFQKLVTMRKKLESNPMEVYKYIYSKIIVDDGKLTELSAEAHEIYNNYKTPDKEKKNIVYWLSSTKRKLLSAIRSNDDVKISYLVSTNTWKVLEGVWAINNKPIPPSSLAFNTHNALSFPLDNWFEDLFVEDILSRANTMIKIIDIICK